METKELSRNEKCKSMVSELMIEELTHEEVLSIIRKYFKDCQYKDLANIALCGMNFSFYSDQPLLTAGIYYRNIIKTSEVARSRFNESLVNAFKNMIMEMGRTNIKIKNPEEYRKLQQDFNQNFHQKPPKSRRVLNSILNDKKSINKMIYHPEYYLRVKKIFRYVDQGEIKEIKSLILKDLMNELNELKSKKPSKATNQDKRDLEIHFLEKKIKLINRDDEWIK